MGLRATPQQEAILRRAAEATHRSLTDFILESACQAAEHALLDQRLFVVTGSEYRSLLDLLDRPPAENAGLRELFSGPAPWIQMTLRAPVPLAPAHALDDFDCGLSA